MNRNEIRKIQELLEQQLDDKKMLAFFGWNRTELQRRLKAPAFRQALKNFEWDREHLCAQVLEICREEMGRFCPEPPEGWLSLLYRYGRHVLYPENFPQVLDKGQERPALFYVEVLRRCV